MMYKQKASKLDIEYSIFFTKPYVIFLTLSFIYWIMQKRREWYISDNRGNNTCRKPLHPLTRYIVLNAFSIPVYLLNPKTSNCLSIEFVVNACIVRASSSASILSIAILLEAYRIFLYNTCKVQKYTHRNYELF